MVVSVTCLTRAACRLEIPSTACARLAAPTSPLSCLTMHSARLDPPDLVLLDLRLPTSDGLSVCQQLTDAPETCGIPVIIVSGMERPDIVRRSRAVGCQYFVRKPYDPSALLVLVEHALAESN